MSMTTKNPSKIMSKAFQDRVERTGQTKISLTFDKLEEIYRKVDADFLLATTEFMQQGMIQEGFEEQGARHGMQVFYREILKAAKYGEMIQNEYEHIRNEVEAEQLREKDNANVLTIIRDDDNYDFCTCQNGLPAGIAYCATCGKLYNNSK